MSELTITRTLDADPQRVWAAFTSAQALAAWFWPGSLQTSVEVDLRIGGRYRIASSVAGMAVIGEFVALDAPNRLVQTWAWEGEERESIVTVTFGAAAGGGTVLTVVHERNASDEERDQHAQGWNDCLDRLPSYLLS